jgi:poly(hydroxyalkanoate) depolymerase family esterase
MWIAGELEHAERPRRYKLWLPGGYGSQPHRPLVLMLHGCTQNPDDFAAGTRLNDLADAEGFLVVYPEQSAAHNGRKCWHWFRPEHQQRGQGEPAELAALIRHLQTHYPVDPARTYAAGISAGAAMTVILGATYPELFAAIAVHSGLAYRAGHDVPTAIYAQTHGATEPLPQVRASRLPRVIVFQGTADEVVAPVNADQIVAQWTGASEAPQIQTLTLPGSRRYTRRRQLNEHGVCVLEQWLIEGLGHAWSGGSPAGSYTDPHGPDASAALWHFFQEPIDH